MNYKKIFAILAVTLSVSMGLTACSFGKKDEEQPVVEEETPVEEEVVVEEPKEEEPEEEPEAAPDLQVSTYTSADGKISIKLPDATWSVKADQDGLYSFGSPEQGGVMIERGVGEEAMSTQIIPKTQDTADTLENGEAGSDYEIQNFIAAEENGNGIYSYTVKMLKDDSDYAYKLMKILANDGEYFIVTGSVVGGDADSIAAIQGAMETIQILDETSTLRGLLAPVVEEAETPAEAPVEAEQPEAPAPAAEGGIAPSRDNPDNADNTKTRTIYTNDGAGRAIVVTLNADGVWVDENGNQYRFQNESDVYDQNDVDYYYHGEAADVYFLPVE